jgi:ketosteroid isomerase-like protein
VNNTELAKALFAAFASGDENAVRSLCSPELKAIQNHGPPMSLDSLLKFSMAVHGIVDAFRYEEAIRSATADGFVEEHSVRGTLPDGTDLRLAACVVAEVRHGKISQLREYLDGSAAAGLSEALAQARVRT